MPWYEVTVEARKIICIEAENKDQAENDAYNEVFTGCNKDCFPAELLETAEEISCSKKHADEIMPLYANGVQAAADGMVQIPLEH